MASDLQQLAEEYAEDPSSRNRDAVILAAVPLVRSLVGRITIPDHPLASWEDLENAGILGLMQALGSYDPARGTAFASYIYGRVRGAIVDYLRSIDALPRERRKRLAEAHHAIDVLRQKLGGDPEDWQVAKHLGVTLKVYHNTLVDAQRRFSLSLYGSGDSEDEFSPLETIANPAGQEAQLKLERASLIEYLSKLIGRLPEREQNIIALYYYENLTLRQIASVLNLTEARISQILGKILLTLRSDMHRVGSKAA